jgi:K+-transporting ATPase KdpF subunit
MIVAGMRADDLTGLVISVLLAAYLVYALIRPERM